MIAIRTRPKQAIAMLMTTMSLRRSFSGLPREARTDMGGLIRNVLIKASRRNPYRQPAGATNHGASLCFGAPRPAAPLPSGKVWKQPRGVNMLFIRLVQAADSRSWSFVRLYSSASEKFDLPDFVQWS